MRTVRQPRRPVRRSFIVCIAGLAIGAPGAGTGQSPPATIEAPERISAIDRVWSGHPVGFALTVTASTIYVAYYDSLRQLTVASRPRGGIEWRFHKLDSWVGWDSHNGIAMAVDAAGGVHVAGNMHNDPLVYYRTRTPGDIRTLARVPMMVDAAVERRVTYPVFLTLPDGRLAFKYRDGGSGNGNEIYNLHDAATQSWRALLRTPLVDGQGRRNAYFMGPVRGPDGMFHLTWVWRDTPMADTNHDLSYARSRDLLHWTRSDGTPLTLPITLATAEVVDPVPVRGGMINNNTVIGFDPAGRVTITYHAFDAAGDTQIRIARREAKGWRIAQASDWRGFHWDFGGGGSLDSRVGVSGAEPLGQTRLRVPVVRDGRATDLLLDTATLRRLGEVPRTTLAARLAGARIAVPAGMTLNTLEAPSGIAIAWPTRPAARDRASEDIPDPTVLRLIEPASQPR